MKTNLQVVLLVGMALLGPGAGWGVAQEPKLRATIDAADAGWVRCVAISPDGKTLASSGRDHVIKLWDVASRKNLAILKGHNSESWSVAFSPDGTKLVSVGGKCVKLWDVATGRNIFTLEGDVANAYSVTFSPDGKTLASATADKCVYLWDVTSGKNTATLAGHKGAVTCVAFSPDGKTLAAASGSIYLWDVASGKNSAILQDGKFGSWRVAFSPDGRTLATPGRDGTDAGSGAVKLWDVATGKCLATRRQKDNSMFHAAAFSPDGTTLAVAGEHQVGWIELWDVTDPARPLGVNTLKGHASNVYSLAWSEDGKTLASGSRDKTIRLWDVNGGTRANKKQLPEAR